MRKITLALIAILISATAVQAQKIKHPSLLFTPERVSAAKNAMRNDTVMQNAWQHIKGVADKQLESRTDIMKLEYLALAYMMTGDDAYADRLKEVLLSTAKTKSWGYREMLARRPAWRSELQMAHRSFQIAVAYDVIYDRLTPSERMQIARGMYDLAARANTHTFAQLHGPQLVDLMCRNGRPSRSLDQQRTSRSP